MTKIIKRCFCHFCIEYVCDRDCLSDEKFVIARNFNLEYDLTKRTVCSSAAMFLNRRNYIKIRPSHPQISMQDGLYQFMVLRRQLHKIFDLIKCDAWVNIMEKNGFLSEKNMILKDCYISISQLNDYSTGHLQKRVYMIG